MHWRLKWRGRLKKRIWIWNCNNFATWTSIFCVCQVFFCEWSVRPRVKAFYSYLVLCGPNFWGSSILQTVQSALGFRKPQALLRWCDPPTRRFDVLEFMPVQRMPNVSLPAVLADNVKRSVTDQSYTSVCHPFPFLLLNRLTFDLDILHVWVMAIDRWHWKSRS